MTVSENKTKVEFKQITYLCNGNSAAAKAIMHIGYDGEGYYPITPSSEVGEDLSKYISKGESDMSFVVGTSELAAISIVTGMALAGGRAIDVTSANGLLLKAEQMPAISGLGLPIVLNLSTREVSGPLNIKNGHSDLAAALGWGWMILCASTVQEVYDFNIIAIKLAEAVNLPVIVAYDGFHTSHGIRRIMIFDDPNVVSSWVGPTPPRINCLDLNHPHTMGPYMNDDLINAKVQQEMKMDQAYALLPSLFQSFQKLSGRKYDYLKSYGTSPSNATLVMLNSAAETSRISLEEYTKREKKVNLVIPSVLRPWPEKEIYQALQNTKTILVAERVSQFGASNYLANEMGATLQRHGKTTPIIQRTYGIGGINFTPEDANHFFDLALHWNELPTHERKIKEYYGAWAGDPNYKPKQNIKPLSTLETTLNTGKETTNLRELAAMPNRFEKHSACPGCGIFTNLNLFLQGIDGQVVFVFNTGCGMVVTTGYPLTSFKVPYVHNLFHNGSSTATGIVEMIKRFRAKGKIKEEITVLMVTGDGGDDIGMDQLIGAALRNDPFIVLEYDNKGYMNTGGQLCYTGIKGQRNSNAHVGNNQKGKINHHKDIIQILRGTYAPYLFQACESHPKDMIMKARKAQTTARSGGFSFGKVFSTCPLNWGSEEKEGNNILDLAVQSCLHPLYEIENGKTKINYNPEDKGNKIPVTDLFAKMGSTFSHLATPEFRSLSGQIQEEVNRRWEQLKAMAMNEVL